MLILLHLAQTAFAGACCVGTTSTLPIMVGECEHAIAGISVGSEMTVGHWTADGKLVKNSIQETNSKALVGGGYRFNRNLQVGFRAPFLLNHRASDSLSGWGGGLGDINFGVTYDPYDEAVTQHAVPTMTLGFTGATGQDWTQGGGQLGEGVTGLEASSIDGAVSLERTIAKYPWSLSGGLNWGIGSNNPHRTVLVAGGIGMYFGNSWSALGTLDWSHSWYKVSDTAFTNQTKTGIRIVHGKALNWRWWLDFRSGLPIVKLGHSSNITISSAVGFAKVW